MIGIVMTRLNNQIEVKIYEPGGFGIIRSHQRVEIYSFHLRTFRDNLAVARVPKSRIHLPLSRSLIKDKKLRS